MLLAAPMLLLAAPYHHSSWPMLLWMLPWLHVEVLAQAVVACDLKVALLHPSQAPEDAFVERVLSQWLAPGSLLPCTVITAPNAVGCCLKPNAGPLGLSGTDLCGAVAAAAPVS
eukprot:3520750-Lingulodinium_polyedra.AAC.1